jgi:hypothetical protein
MMSWVRGGGGSRSEDVPAGDMAGSGGNARWVDVDGGDEKGGGRGGGRRGILPP